MRPERLTFSKNGSIRTCSLIWLSARTPMAAFLIWLVVGPVAPVIRRLLCSGRHRTRVETEQHRGHCSPYTLPLSYLSFPTKHLGATRGGADLGSIPLQIVVSIPLTHKMEGVFRGELGNRAQALGAR